MRFWPRLFGSAGRPPAPSLGHDAGSERQRSADDLVQRIVGSDPILPLEYTELRIACDGLVSFGAEAARAIDAAVSRVLESGSKAKFFHCRYMLTALGRVKERQALDVLEKYASAYETRDDYRNIREGAIEGLGLRGSASAGLILRTIRRKFAPLASVIDQAIARCAAATELSVLVPSKGWNPEHGAGWYEVAHSFVTTFGQGDIGPSFAAFEKLRLRIAAFPAVQRHGAWFEVGRQFHTKRKYTLAVQCFVQALVEDPNRLSSTWNHIELPIQHHDLLRRVRQRAQFDPLELAEELQAVIGLPGG